MNKDTLYQKFLADPNSVSSSDLAKISFEYKYDETLSHDKKKKLLPYFMPYFERFPDKLIPLIDSEEYYLNLVESNSRNYFKLCHVDHPYKELEERLFDKYAHLYTLSTEEQNINYAAKSNIVLRNTLENFMWPYLISFFDKEAYDEETVNFIAENKSDNLGICLNHNAKSVLCSYPNALKKILDRDCLFLTTLHDSYLTEEVCESINLTKQQSKKLYDYVKGSKYCRMNANLCALLLRDYPDIIEDYKNDPTDYLIKCILKNNLHFNEKWCDDIAKDQRIIKDALVHDSVSLDYWFNHFISFDDDNIELLIKSIIRNNYKVKIIQNSYFKVNSKLINFLIKYYHIDSNYFNIADSELVSNVGRNLEKLREVFSDNDIMIIKREIVDNNYFLDLETIINNISFKTFKYIYNSLYKIESRIGENCFSFFFFIKFCEYFANNPNLLKELEEHFKDIDNAMLDNLSLALNHNFAITYQDLQNYKSYYQQKIIHDDSLNTKEKLLKYYFNATEQQAIFFKEHITDLIRLTRLQLEFPKESYNYNFLELYISLIQLLDGILSDKIVSFDNLQKFSLTPLADLEVMRENILRLYGIYYYEKNLDEKKLESKGKIKVANDKKVIDITGEDFCFYVHSNNFNSQYDFTDSYFSERSIEMKNYICTSIANQLSFDFLHHQNFTIYDMPDPNSLLAFGNRDIAIDQTTAPLITVAHPYYTDIDEVCLRPTTKYGLYAKNEFDFLRTDHNNKPFVPKYSHSNLYLDEKKHFQIMNEKYTTLCKKIEILSYHDLNELIVMSKIFGIDEETLNRLKERVLKLDAKEQMVLFDAIDKYAFLKTKEDNKKR